METKPNLKTVNASWSWTGLEASELIVVNSFGNLILVAVDGKYWRICPEELTCEVIAEDSLAYQVLLEDTEFKREWLCNSFVNEAYEHLGEPGEGRCYCLKIPSVLGGEYTGANFGTIPLLELISFAGDVAHQIKDLPDGTQVEFKFVD